MVDENTFLCHTLGWPPPTTPADMGNDFHDMMQDFDFLEDLGGIEGSSSNAPRHFHALSVGGAAPSNAESSDQPRPVLNVQGDMTVSGIVRAERFIPVSDENAKCHIHNTDHNALNVLQQLKIYQYQFKSRPQGRQVLALLAQELEKVVPDFVATDHDGVKRVDFTSLLSLSVQAIQQLSAQQLSAQQQDTDSRLSFVLLKIGSLTRRLELSLHASITRPGRVEANSQQAVQQLAMTAEAAMVEPATAEPATAEPTTADPAMADPATAQAATVCDSVTESKALPDFKDNDAMVRHMLEALGETNDGIHEMVLNRIVDFDHQSVWDSFQEALPQRCKGKRLCINSLKKKQQELRMRSVAFHL